MIINGSLAELDNYLIEHLGSKPNKNFVLKERRYIRWGKLNECWLTKNDKSVKGGNWITGVKFTLYDKGVKNVFSNDVDYAKLKLEEIKEKKNDADKMKKIWNAIVGPSQDCGYFKRKGLEMPSRSLIDIRYDAGINFIAYYNYINGLCAIQRIFHDSTKRWITDSRTAGAFTCLTNGKMLEKKYLLFVEGVATGLSVYYMMQEIEQDIAVVIVGSCYNYIPVYEVIRPKYKGNIIVIGEEGPNNKLLSHGIPHIIFNAADFDSDKGEFDANDAYVLDRGKALNLLKESFKKCQK